MQPKPFKPRNPLVAAALLRSGSGAHQKSGKALRQQARQQLRRALKGKMDFEAGFGQRIVSVF